MRARTPRTSSATGVRVGVSLHTPVALAALGKPIAASSLQTSIAHRPSCYARSGLYSLLDLFFSLQLYSIEECCIE